MKKIIILLVFSILLSACQDETDPNLYPLNKLESFIQTDELYSKNKIIDFPSDIRGEKSYEKKDLENLDYNKEVTLGDIYFRIPEKSAIFKNKEKYYIDLPLNESYKIMISFRDYSKFFSYDLDSICQALIKSGQIKGDIITNSIKNPINSLESMYFISRCGDIYQTHFFIKSQTSIIYFIISEDIKLSQASEKIMADLLISAYASGYDPFELRKSFADHKEAINIFASKEVYLDNFRIKIPENFYPLQDDINFKSFIAKNKTDTIGEIIIRKDKTPESSIYDIYNKNSGDYFYPAKLVNMGPLEEKNNILSGNVRFFLQTNSLSGKKFVIKKDDYYITLVVVGPLANESLNKSMADAIIGTLKN